MFYDQSDPGFPEWESNFSESSGPTENRHLQFLAEGEESPSASSVPLGAGYEKEIIESVWDCAEIVPGTDAVLWRKDELGDWIYRADYGRRSSRFGWEIFNPGIGRHCQGVYAMRPMQWQNYIDQHSTLL